MRAEAESFAVAALMDRLGVDHVELTLKELAELRDARVTVWADPDPAKATIHIHLKRPEPQEGLVPA